jgi:hypothetical protein
VSVREYLTKPLDIQQFWQVIEEVLKGGSG